MNRKDREEKFADEVLHKQQEDFENHDDTGAGCCREDDPPNWADTLS